MKVIKVAVGYAELKVIVETVRDLGLCLEWSIAGIYLAEYEVDITGYYHKPSGVGYVSVLLSEENFPK